MKKALLLTALLLSLAGGTARAQWNYDIPFPKPLRSTPDTVSVCIIGDVMMHSGQMNRDWSEFLKRVAGPMRGADIAIANMEFTLAGEPYSGYPAFSAPDAYAWRVCEDLGLDLMLTANNHILDKGRAGAERTLEVYDSLRSCLGVENCGMSRSTEEDEDSYPAIFLRKGIRIAFIPFTYGTNAAPQYSWPKVNRMTKEDIGAAFGRARERGADFIVALPHWGIEYELRHSAGQARWAEWLAAQGACAIVGAHPHVVQDTTHIAGVPVIYSLGNAVSNMSAKNTRLELMVTLRFISDPSSGEKRMLEPELRFMWCTLPGRLTGSYATIFTKEWTGCKDSWSDPSDYLNMVGTLERVKAATGIEAD